MTVDPRSLAIFATLVALILAASAIVASAENAPTYRSHRPEYGWNAHRFIEVHHRRRYRKPPPPRYREREEAAHGRCKSPVAVVGDQFVTEAGAKGEADKAWSAAVRWQFGERYLDRENASDVFYECGRSSVGSVAGQVFHRCRISARPCRPEPQRGDR